MINVDVGTAKILPEHLDDILAGKKTYEMRSLETITLTDGKRSHTFKIADITVPDTETYHCMEYILKHTFPRFLNDKAPTIFLKLGEEIIRIHDKKAKEQGGD